MKRQVEMFIAYSVIGILFFIVAIPCLVAWPFRILIDRAAKKNCMHCSNREEQYEIIYNRTEGSYTCNSCGKVYSLKREC